MFLKPLYLALAPNGMRNHPPASRVFLTLNGFGKENPSPIRTGLVQFREV
jgi:hypothetical protein